MKFEFDTEEKIKMCADVLRKGGYCAWFERLKSSGLIMSILCGADKSGETDEKILKMAVDAHMPLFDFFFHMLVKSPAEWELILGEPYDKDNPLSQLDGFAPEDICKTMGRLLELSEKNKDAALIYDHASTEWAIMRDMLMVSARDKHMCPVMRRNLRTCMEAFVATYNDGSKLRKALEKLSDTVSGY